MASFGLGPKPVCLRKKPAGIEGDNFDIDVLAEDRVGDGLNLGAKACRKDDAAGYLLAHGRNTLGEIKRRKRLRDAKNLGLKIICLGQGRPRCNKQGTINEASSSALAIGESLAAYFRIEQRAESRGRRNALH